MGISFDAKLPDKVFKAITQDPRNRVPNATDVESNRRACNRSSYSTPRKSPAPDVMSPAGFTTNPCINAFESICAREKAKQAAQMAADLTFIFFAIGASIPFVSKHVSTSKADMAKFATDLGNLIYTNMPLSCKITGETARV